MKTNELNGNALNWAVQKCEGARKDIDFAWWTEDYAPSTDWAQGGPIIERERIELVPNGKGWDALQQAQHIPIEGPTPLIAAMRCYVAKKLGDEVELPEELK